MIDLSQKSILVTGGAGFIGSNIIKKLQPIAKFIRIVDNLSTGFYKNIQPFLKYSNVQFIQTDITNFDVCKEIVKDMDIICHQAALGSIPRSIKDPLSSHNTNVNGFLNLLIAAKDAGIKRFVYASSSAVYGTNNDPTKVEANIGKHLSPYAITKYVDELYANLFCTLYGIKCIGLRYFNVFGPNQNPDGEYAAVVPKFIKQLMLNEKCVINGDGSVSRDYTYVDNAVDANLLAMTTSNANAYGEVFNIGCGDTTTLNELYSYISLNMNRDIKPIYGPKRIGDIQHSKADISKAKKILGYNPQTTMKNGLVSTISHYLLTN